MHERSDIGGLISIFIIIIHLQERVDYNCAHVRVEHRASGMNGTTHFARPERAASIDHNVPQLSYWSTEVVQCEMMSGVYSTT